MAHSATVIARMRFGRASAGLRDREFPYAKASAKLKLEERRTVHALHANFADS